MPDAMQSEQQIEQIMFANVREEYAFRVVEWARPADKDGFEFPNRVLFAALGLVLGGVAGLAFAVGRTVLGAGKAG